MAQEDSFEAGFPLARRQLQRRGFVDSGSSTSTPLYYSRWAFFRLLPLLRPCGGGGVELLPLQRPCGGGGVELRLWGHAVPEGVALGRARGA